MARHKRIQASNDHTGRVIEMSKIIGKLHRLAVAPSLIEFQSLFGYTGGRWLVHPTYRIPIILNMTTLVPLASLTFRDLSWQNPYTDLKDVASEEI